MDNSWSPSLLEVQARLKEVYAFIDQHRTVCDAHSVDYYIGDHWNTLLSKQWRAEILTMTSENEFINPQLHDGLPSRGSLLEFLIKAKHLRLPLTTFPKEICQEPPPSGLASFGMTAKKSHEVEKFARCVYELVRKGGVNQVIDVGSGKGYLSEHLALKYGVTVIGFDSKDGNTAGALKRNKKVQDKCKSLPQAKNHTIMSTLNPNTKDELNIVSKNLTTHTTFDEALLVSDLNTSPDSSDVSETKDQSESIPSKDTNKRQEHCAVNVSSSTTPPQSYFPVTMTINGKNYGELLNQAEISSSGQFRSKDEFCIVGLHACGDLTSTALKMFTSIPNATAIAVVGCCYHHITEDYSTGGFPMSLLMKCAGCYLGRTSRMLACQTLSKFRQTTTEIALLRIHWRALLQVLLARKFPELFISNFGSDLIVGRLKKTTTDFKEYCAIALKRLNLDTAKVKDADIIEIELEHSSRLVEIQGFIRVRTVLASCIETCIILDRFLYILEQEDKLSLLSSRLVQLFDPVVSPRCYAVVSLKRGSPGVPCNT